MVNRQKILITGGSGLVASALSEKLVSQGYEVSFLSRKKKSTSAYPVFLWDIPTGFLEEGALEGVDHIVHLAGAGIANGRWSEARKKLIESSRVEGAHLLFEKIKTSKHNLRSFISASAVGIYEKNRDELLTEKSDLASDFLGRVCVNWEAAAGRFIELGVRVALVRTGIALSPLGGALPKMAAPVKMMIGSSLGTGEQVVPWIDMDDLCAVYVRCIEDEKMEGAYNAVSPHSVSNKRMIQALGRVLRRPLFFPDVPQFVLKGLFGEMACLLLDSQKISSKKLVDAGFKFQFPSIENSLKRCYFAG